MNDSATAAAAEGLALSRYAKLVVFGAFVLVLLGSHTTTAGAGMAFPDWPLSSNSLFPPGWWENTFQRLEHSHRMAAESVALLIAILCAWVWGSKWALPTALFLGIVSGFGAQAAGYAHAIIAQASLAGAAAGFIVVLFLQLRRSETLRPAGVRWLAFAAFALVLVQAVLGGLRVTVETAGNPSTALILRIVHGCFAQFELCLLVSLAALLSPVWRSLSPLPGMRATAAVAWLVCVCIFAQLIVGASMRHLGAGLAIPSWPQAEPGGAWMPKVHTLPIDLNFTHTRAGAALVALLVVVLALRTLGFAGREVRLIRPAALLVALTSVQVVLGLLIIWNLRPPLLATAHVLNGAALLATAVLLALRTSRCVTPTVQAEPEAVSAGSLVQAKA